MVSEKAGNREGGDLPALALMLLTTEDSAIKCCNTCMPPLEKPEAVCRGTPALAAVSAVALTAPTRPGLEEPIPSAIRVRGSR